MQPLLFENSAFQGQSTAMGSVPLPLPHIVHVTECLAGGTLGYLELALRELDDMGFKQTLLYSKRPDTPADVQDRLPSDVAMHELPAARGAHLDFIRALASSLPKVMNGSASVAVHLHSSKAGFVGRWALRGLDKKGVRCLYSPHGLAFLNRRRRLASTLYYGLEWVAGCMGPFQPVGCGHGEADLLERLTQQSAFVLENPVPDAFFEVVRAPVSPPMVISIGRACEQKAPEVFAELAVRANIDEIKAQFVWVGGGEPEREAFLRAAGVKVTGWVNGEQVRQYLSQCSVYVQTSRWEGMPLSVLQAMAAGVPSVVSDVVGNRDAIRHAKTGLIGGDTDALMRNMVTLIENPVLAKQFGEAARQDAHARFGRAQFRKRLRELYTQTNN